MNYKRMSEIKVGESVEVFEINAENSLKRRFNDFGLIEGNQIICVGKSPLGDPKAFEIDGTVIAIRNSDAEKIIVQ